MSHVFVVYSTHSLTVPVLQPDNRTHRPQLCTPHSTTRSADFRRVLDVQPARDSWWVRGYSLLDLSRSTADDSCHMTPCGREGLITTALMGGLRIVRQVR